MGSTTVIIFAKAPVPGAVKTRLIPALGPAGAARLDEDRAAGADSVFVPTADGGFALTGFRGEALTAIDEVFAAIPWSTSAVMSAVRHHLSHAGLRWIELATLVDVDEPTDLIHVPREWLGMEVGAPAVANRRR